MFLALTTNSNLKNPNNSSAYITYNMTHMHAKFNLSRLISLVFNYVPRDKDIGLRTQGKIIFSRNTVFVVITT